MTSTIRPAMWRICAALLFTSVTNGVGWAYEAQSLSPAAEQHVHSRSDAANYPHEAPFLAENAASMDKMMADMDVAPTGDVDRDFVAMMVPHHQGAIDMAIAVLRYGKNEQIRRLAQEIIVTQQQEIAAMHLAIGDAPPALSAAPTQISPAADAPGNNPVHQHNFTAE